MPKLKETRNDRICKRLKAAQVLKGMTQKDVARRLQVDRTTVSKWYNNIDNVSVGNFRLLCQVLSIVPDEILSIT